ncbi:Phosphoribosylamidoimidazole-succinocarboxamide synthase [Bacillus thuringiensis serovar israelensis ATCC 35646]|nr:Phosphoribosylamidoimidazole-succinocarboxamide synthase [Bacillus thuringiensis serovar israelensis ATCC 35646]
MPLFIKTLFTFFKLQGACEMQKLELLYEGKAKRIYRTESADMVWVEYKDSATAFNGEKKETITGKGRLNNEITTLLFRKLQEVGIKTHLVEKLSETEQTCQKSESYSFRSCHKKCTCRKSFKTIQEWKRELYLPNQS